MGALNPGEATAADRTSDKANVEIFLDEIAVGILSEDINITGDASIETALLRRLCEGLRYLRIVGFGDISWRPILKDSYSISLNLAQTDIATLDEAADVSGYGKDVLVVSLLSSSICEPLEITLHRKEAIYSPSDAFRELRRIPGKGNIYPISFELPGYQIVFMKMLSGVHGDKELAIEAGLLALARQMLSGNLAPELEVTAESYAFAKRMVSFANGLPAPRV